MPKQIAGVILYDLQEVSSKIGLSVRTLREYIKSSKIEAKKLGRSYHINETEIQRFLKATWLYLMISRGYNKQTIFTSKLTFKY